MIRIGIVAGEASGDNLGAELIRQIKQLHADVSFSGIGGSNMQAAGCDCLYSTDDLSVMGFSEVLGKLPHILQIRRNLLDYFRKDPPDVFIGIDAPDFNIPVERKLRKKYGIKTVHYISPSVWAWREYRLRSIANAVDLMLVMFPFEKTYYEDHGIRAAFTGHPLASELSGEQSRETARADLGIPADGKIITLMPGSRRSELQQLVGPFIETARWCKAQRGDLSFICNLVNASHREFVESVLREHAPELDIHLFTGRSLQVMAAGDVILLASGTAALEALLLKRPMVVAYRVNSLTYYLAKWLITLPWVSLPNILAGEKIVPECLQSDCQPEKMGPLLLEWLENEQAATTLIERFRQIHAAIHPRAGDDAARAVLDIVHAG